jgi:glycosyltransferase involved in cell wall biosynthesis
VKTPLVTIGMPVFNCESTVAESIASILNQTFQDWELVVYDDGSCDGTLAAARKFKDPRIQLVEGGPNRGLPACLNRIIADCESEFFARMDGDDVAYSHRLEIQMDALRRNPAVDLLGGSVLICDQQGVATGLRRAAKTHKEICGKPWRIANLVHVTWIGRTAWFKQHPYNEWATHSQDRDLLIRVRREATFAALSEVLVGVREAKPLWQKLLPARKQLLKTAVTEGLRQRDPALLFVTTAAEVMKTVLDAVATWTGLNHHLLKHRIPPASADDVASWHEVLQKTRATVLELTGEREAVSQ